MNTAAEKDLSMTFKDLIKDLPEDTFWPVKQIDESFVECLTAELETTVESKYLYIWESLSEQEKNTAYGKALAAYDRYGSWKKGNDLSKSDIEKLKKSKEKKDFKFSFWTAQLCATQN